VDDNAFQPDTPEAELHDQATVLMAGGALKNRRGHALLTNDRVIFLDQRFDVRAAWAVGGILTGLVAEQLEKRREKQVLVDLPLADITRVSHETKLTVRDILVIEGGGQQYRFANGLKAWNPLLRRALTERHGKAVADEGDDGWRVTG